MRARITIIALLLCGMGVACAQSKSATIANFVARAADTAQTCYDFHRFPHGAVQEVGMPFNSCRGIAFMNGGFALGSYFLDRELSKRGHPKLGRWAQWSSFAGASWGILYSSTHRLK
jgi:hypothetical protein